MSEPAGGRSRAAAAEPAPTPSVPRPLPLLPHQPSSPRSRLPPAFPPPLLFFPRSPSSVFSDPALSLALFLSFSLSPDSFGCLFLWFTLCQHLFSPPFPHFPSFARFSSNPLFSLYPLSLCYFLLLLTFAVLYSPFSPLPPLSLGWVRTGCAPPPSSCSSEWGRGEPLGSKGTKGAPSHAGHNLRTERPCQGWMLGPHARV